MGRKLTEVQLTLENAREALKPGDIVFEAEELGQVVSARPDVRNEWVRVYFMGGDCYVEDFAPQKLFVLRETGTPEHEWVGRPIGTHVMVEISKTGGGTVGKRYTGRWNYRITVKGKVVAEGDDMNTPKVVTHEEAARIAWAFQDAAYAADYLSED